MFPKSTLIISTVAVILFGLFAFSPTASAYQIGVSPNMLSLRSGLVGYWTFDGKDMPNGVALDMSGNFATGTPVNIATSTFYAAGKIGQALNFDGVNDYVRTASTITFNSNISTVSFWYKVANDTASDSDVMLELSSNFNNNDGTFVIFPHSISYSGKFAVGIQDSVGTSKYRVESVSRPSVGVWHHYSVILNNSTTLGDIVIYIDNVLQTTGVELNIKDQSSNLKTDTLYFMSRGGSSLFEDGILDDVRIYNRALSANEIKQLYNLGR